MGLQPKYKKGQYVTHPGNGKKVRIIRIFPQAGGWWYELESMGNVWYSEKELKDDEEY